MKSKILILCVIILASACSNGSVQISPTPTVISTPTLQPTSIIQPTETPQPTPTYLSITPVLQGTQLPEHGDIITVENIDRLTLLSSLGKGNPTDVIYTPDGKYFVISTSEGLYFYNPVDYTFIHFIDTQTAVMDITVSPDSQRIAAAVTNEILLYQISNWQLLLSIKVEADSLDFSPDGKMIALGINSEIGGVQFRDVETGNVIKTFGDRQAVWTVKISPKGDAIATGGYSSIIWSLDGSILDQFGPYISGGHTASISFSPDGDLLAEGSDYYLKIWRVLDNGRVLNYREIDLSQYDNASIFDVAISPDGKSVAATLSSGVGVWNLSTGQCVFYSAVESGFASYNSLAWSPDSSTVAVASNQKGVELWSIKQRDKLTTLNNPSGSFSSLAWSPDGKKLGVGADEGITYILDTNDGHVFDEFGSGYELNSIAFAPDNSTLALGYGDRTAQIWNLDGTLQQKIEGFGFGPSDVTFTSDGKFFAAILPESWQTPPQVRIWNTRDWVVEKVFPVGDRDNFMITGFALAPDQNTGAISYVDMHGFHTQYIRIISVHNGTTLATLEPRTNNNQVRIDAIGYSPDNSMLAALATVFDDPNPRMLVWKTSDWSLVYQINIHSGSRLGLDNNRSDSLSWSPDSRLIAAGVKDGCVQIFKADNGENLATFDGHTMAVTGVSFSPDGRILASISINGTLKLWGLR